VLLSPAITSAECSIFIQCLQAKSGSICRKQLEQSNKNELQADFQQDWTLKHKNRGTHKIKKKKKQTGK
jgi:hypothetical protein